MKNGCIIGWAHTRFGKLDEPDVEALMARVSRESLTHAEVAPEDVDGVFVGVMNAGFSKQSFEGAQVALGLPELAHVPLTEKHGLATFRVGTGRSLDQRQRCPTARGER